MLGQQKTAVDEQLAEPHRAVQLELTLKKNLDASVSDKTERVRQLQALALHTESRNRG